MELDFDTPELAGRAYPILSALVTPRPIALVTTIDSAGRINAAPFSFFNMMGARPPICVFAPGNRNEETPKDTVLNIRAAKEFVVNLVDEGIAESMNACATSLPYGESELELAGLTPVVSRMVAPPRIAEAPASLECEAYDMLEIGENRMVIGLIKRVHVRDALYDPKTRRINLDSYFPIGRMASPDNYCRTRDRFHLPFPK